MRLLWPFRPLTKMFRSVSAEFVAAVQGKWNQKRRFPSHFVRNLRVPAPQSCGGEQRAGVQIPGSFSDQLQTWPYLKMSTRRSR